MIKYPHIKNKEILIIRIIYPHSTLKTVREGAVFMVTGRVLYSMGAAF